MSNKQPKQQSAAPAPAPTPAPTAAPSPAPSGEPVQELSTDQLQQQEQAAQDGQASGDNADEVIEGASEPVGEPADEVVQEEAPAPASAPEAAPVAEETQFPQGSGLTASQQKRLELGLTHNWSDNIIDLMARLKSSGNIRAFNNLLEVDLYNTKYGRPYVHSEEDVARASLRFYRNVVDLVETTDKEFNIAFSALLAMFHESGEATYVAKRDLMWPALHDRMIFRCTPQWQGTPEEYEGYNALMTLFCAVADPKGRADVIRVYNPVGSVQKGLSETGRTRIRGFLKL